MTTRAIGILRCGSQLLNVRYYAYELTAQGRFATSVLGSWANRPHRSERGQFWSLDGDSSIIDNRRVRIRNSVFASCLNCDFKMTTEELRENLLQLIETYVIDPRVHNELKLSVNRDDIPVKGILIQLASFMSGRVSEIDKKIIGEIAFYFC